MADTGREEKLAAARKKVQQQRKRFLCKQYSLRFTITRADFPVVHFSWRNFNKNVHLLRARPWEKSSIELLILRFTRGIHRIPMNYCAMFISSRRTSDERFSKSKSLVCDEFLVLLSPDWSKHSCNSFFDVLWLYFDSRPDSDAVAEQSDVCLLAKNYILCDSNRRNRSWK